MKGAVTDSAPATPDTTHRVVWRVRLLAGVLLLAAVAFRQAGGLIVPDTKLDLTANPGEFLARALHMWDPSGAFGQLQNQAYGYLFPVGTFHWVLDLAQVPDWVVQRLWWTTVLSVAFLGVWRLSGAMGMGSPWARYVAALLYALGPRFLSEVAVTSVEVWPMAVAPWVLLPLVVPGPRTWRWRITRSALAFAAIGGVNAVATGAALVLPTVWFATRRQMKESAVAFLGWLAAVVTVSVWWLGPLVLLGSYSPPFLDWIENAAVTTAFASPFEALRGTTPWLNYLTGSGGPAWPGGWQFVTLPALIVASSMLAAAGLAGIRLAPRRHRAFLAASLLVGLALVTAGHVGVAASPVAQPLQELLDGVLAPFRNTHKFELVVRLPLALGVGVALTRLAAWSRRRGLASWLPTVVAVSAVALVAAPALNGGIARPEGYPVLPGYWRDAAAWLDAREDAGTVLVVPAAGFGDFVWGSTKDDPLQALSTRAFAVRDAVPLGSAGATRWLDDVERSLQSGSGGESLRTALRSAGVGHVLVRNDLRADAVDFAGGHGLRVHEALDTAGLDRVATFGPPMGSPPGLPLESSEDTVDQRTRLAYPAVEVFDVGAADGASVVTGEQVVLVDGGAEDVADALAAVEGSRAAVVGSDIAVLPEHLRRTSSQVLTDGNHDREVFFGRAFNNTSSVLASEEDRRTGREVDDYVADPEAVETIRSAEGDMGLVTASSSASDANASLRLGPGYGPQAAVDGDPATAWVSGTYGSSVGEWISLEFGAARSASGLTVALQPLPRRVATPSEVRVDTDTGSATSRLLPGEGAQRVAVPAGVTTTLRVTVTATAEGDGANGVAIAELVVPRLDLGTRLTVGSTAVRAPDVVLVRRADAGRRDCAWVVDRPLCTGLSGRQPESEGALRRSFTITQGLTGTMTGEVVARPGLQVERLLAGVSAVGATASSRAVREPAGRPAAAMDADLGTGWVAAVGDESPSLTLRLPRTIRTDRIQLQRDAFLAASAPKRVQVSLDGRTPMGVDVDEEGYLRWPAQDVRTMDLQFTEITPLRSTDSASGFVQVLPVGVSEVVVPGIDPRGPLSPQASTGATCGFGPELTVGDRRYSTTVAGTAGDLLQGRPLRWEVCDEAAVVIPEGDVAIHATSTEEFIPVSLEVTASGLEGVGTDVSRDLEPTAGVEPSSAVGVTRPDPTRLVAEVPFATEPTLLVIPQNHSEGWQAHDEDGAELTPVRVNGWQQGWVLPAGGDRTVTAVFAPDRAYRLFLAGGALLALVVVVLALWPAAHVGCPPLPARRARGWGWNIVVLVVFAWIAGLLGAVAGGAALLMVALVRSRRTEGTMVVLLAAVSTVVVVTAAPWPQSRAAVDDPLVQVLVLTAVAVAVLASGGSVSPRVRRLLRPHRMTGRSTP